MTNSIRIIVEGTFDASLLKRVLEPRIVEHCHFIYAGGISRLTSVARTHLSINPESVVVVADADSTSPEQIAERREMMRYLLLQAGSEDRFRIVLAVPEIEIVFFNDVTALQNWLGCTVTERQLAQSEFVPKRTLEELLEHAAGNGTFPGNGLTLDLVDHLPEDMIAAIRRHGVVRELEESIKALCLGLLV